MAQDLILDRGGKILFIGDSITAAGRQDPAWAPLGRGYVYFAASLLWANYPELQLHIENRGIGGNTVLDLKDRWPEDALAESPHLLSCLIGINDAIRVVRRGPNHWNLTPDHYERNYGELLQTIKDKCRSDRFVLWEPFLITNDTDGLALELLTAYIEAVHRLGERFGAILIRTQELFDEARQQRSPEYWANDGVHPTPQGHALMAQEFLQAVQP